MRRSPGAIEDINKEARWVEENYFEVVVPQFCSVKLLSNCQVTFVLSRRAVEFRYARPCCSDPGLPHEPKQGGNLYQLERKGITSAQICCIFFFFYLIQSIRPVVFMIRAFRTIAVHWSYFLTKGFKSDCL